MTRGGRRPAFLALAACLALAAVLASSASAARDPARLVLQAQDLPPGFAATLARDRPNAAVAKETGVGLARLRQWGRTGGHEAAFDRTVDPTALPRGPASVVAAVSTYRTTAGLRKAFAASAGRIDKARTPRNVPRELGARLGDAARLWETRFTQDGVPVVLYTLLWRSRGVLAYVSVAGVRGRLTPAQALALARKQQARIASADRGDGPGLVA